MAELFSMQPEVVETFETKYRKIITPIPVPDSIPMLKELQQYEPRSILFLLRSLFMVAH